MGNWAGPADGRGAGRTLRARAARRPPERRRRAGCLTVLLVLLAGAYSLGLVVYAGFRFTIRDGRWWLVALNDFAPFLFLPLAPLVLVALIARSRSLYVVLAPAVALFLFLYGGLFLPKGGAPAEAGGWRLKVLTSNLQVENEASDAVAATLTDELPDVVALQELSPAMARALTAQLGERYQHRALYPQTGGDGSGVFSRHPIRQERVFTLGDSSITCQELTVDVAGRVVRILNVRLRHPQYGVRIVDDFPRVRPVARGVDWQSDEVDDLLGVVDRGGGPTVALGDFNMTDQSPQYRRLARRLGDSFREAGWGFGFTFPDFVTRRGALFNTPPVIRIDYVWHDDGLTPTRAGVARTLGSDHRPVVAEFAAAKP